MYRVHLAENGEQAQSVISSLMKEGFDRNDIYIFAHDKDRSEDLTTITMTGAVGFEEQGFFEAIGNVFKSRGDELRSKMGSVGLSDMEADRYEEELDRGKLVIVGSDEKSH